MSRRRNKEKYQSMPDPELAVLLEIPQDMESDLFLSPVRDGKPPLTFLCERMKKIVAPVDIIVVTSNKPWHAPFGTYVAMQGLFLYRTDEVSPTHIVARAAASRRPRTVLRVNACHIFTDPELLLELHDFHRRQSCHYTAFAGVPQWLGSEAIGTAAAMDVFMYAEQNGLVGREPSELIKADSKRFKSMEYRPKISGRWKPGELSLGNPASAKALLDKLLSAPDPVAVSYRDFLA